MKNFFSYLLSVLLIISSSSSIVHASEVENFLNSSQIKITNQYAESFCNAKADHFFDGLDNEKTLKYSYFKYIGIQGKEKFSKDFYDPLISQIREKCLISKEEERELNEFFLKGLVD